MGIVVVPTYGSDPATVNAANLDAKVSGLATEFNGGIDNDNIDANAAIANSKLNLATITQNIAHSGTMTHSGVVTMSAKDLTEAKGADIASDTTTTIWATDGNFMHITGTTTITSFGTAEQAGDCRTVVFDGALTLTHNATSLILPTGANITTAAGDVAIVRAETTANARVIAYLRKDGSSLTSSGGILGTYKNLKVVRDSVTQVTVTADELILEDSSNNKVTIRSVSEAIAITTSGASGLDTGAEGSSRWYYIWIIRKSSDGTVNGLLSESSSSPTLPSGYDQKALVSAVYNSSGSDFVGFIHKGKRYSYTSWQVLASGNVGTGAWTSVNTSSFVPSALSENANGSMHNATTLGIANDSSVSVTVATAAPNKLSIPGSVPTLQKYWELEILTANTLYWISDSAGNTLYINGFEVTKL